jgi:hypothetical protein
MLEGTLMRIDFLLIADAVEVTNGKLYVLGGGWDLFQSPVYPAIARVGLAAAILFEASELDRIHRVTLRISEVGGHDLLPPIDVEIRPELRTVKTDLVRSILALNPSLQIPGVGVYEVRVKVGEWEQTTRFQAILTERKANLSESAKEMKGTT